jgi:predicted Rossmann fold nucleotide-binding protein DprA/Smf involved in DNA uptake
MLEKFGIVGSRDSTQMSIEFEFSLRANLKRTEAMSYCD